MDADGPRLCLVLGLETSAPAADAVVEVLRVLDAATLVLNPIPVLRDLATVSAIVKAAQAKGVAVLVADDWKSAKDLAADGVHLSWQKDPLDTFETVRQALGPDRILGADVGRSRHDAMEVGEAGADYVAFGLPPDVEDRAQAFERQVELITWWVDVFEIPVVAFDAATFEEVEALAQAGADFIAVSWPSADVSPLAWAETIKASLARAA